MFGRGTSYEIWDLQRERIVPGRYVLPWGESCDERCIFSQENRCHHRCIVWQHVTRDLMATNEACTIWARITRALRGGEAIDFFMSHSWHDDAEIKYAALEDCASSFRHGHGRDPTSWLDKVCIDQNNIAVGLRVLPVNVMACNRMMVLCGHTYQHRLWCVWELFTLFAFAQASVCLCNDASFFCCRLF